MTFRLINDFCEMIGYEFGGALDPEADTDARFAILLREEMREFEEAYKNWSSTRSIIVRVDGSTRPPGTGSTLARASDELQSYEFLDRVLLIDALGDVAFVALGGLHHLGLDSSAVLKEICESNLSKTAGTSERTGGKDAIKGEDFFPPDLTRLIIRAEKPTRSVPAFNEAARLLSTKSEDYLGGGVSRDDYFPFGMKSYVTMIMTKALRILSLTRRGGEARHESLRDSALDLLNYLAFMIDRIDRDSQRTRDNNENWQELLQVRASPMA